MVGGVSMYVWISLSARLSIDLLWGCILFSKKLLQWRLFGLFWRGWLILLFLLTLNLHTFLVSLTLHHTNFCIRMDCSWISRVSSEFASNFSLIRFQTAALLFILFLKRGSKAVASSKKNLMSSFLYRVDRFPQTLFFKSATNAVSPFTGVKCFSSFWMICPADWLFSVGTQSVQV